MYNNDLQIINYFSCFSCYFAFFRGLFFRELSRYFVDKKNHPEFLSGFAVLTRLELATSCVTGRHSNQTELQHLLFLFYQPRYFVVDYGCKDTTFFQICKHFFKKKFIIFSKNLYDIDYQYYQSLKKLFYQKGSIFSYVMIFYS